MEGGFKERKSSKMLEQQKSKDSPLKKTHTLKSHMNKSHNNIDDWQNKQNLKESHKETLLKLGL